MTEDDKKLDGWSDQNLVRYYHTIVKFYPGKLEGDNIIIERLVQRGLAWGAGDTLSLTDAGKAILAAMQAEAYAKQDTLRAALDNAIVDAEHWKRVAAWETDQLVAHLLAIPQKTLGIELPDPLPRTRPELINLLAALWAGDD